MCNVLLKTRLFPLVLLQVKAVGINEFFANNEESNEVSISSPSGEGGGRSKNEMGC